MTPVKSPAVQLPDALRQLARVVQDNQYPNRSDVRRLARLAGEAADAIDRLTNERERPQGE